MAKMNGTETSTTLLGRLALFPLDQAAWDDSWSNTHRWWSTGAGVGAPEADALDVTQMVLSKLAVQMHRFASDLSRSFRTWLRTVALNAGATAWMRGGRMPPAAIPRRSSSSKGWKRDDLVRRLEQQYDMTWNCLRRPAVGCVGRCSRGPGRLRADGRQGRLRRRDRGPAGQERWLGLHGQGERVADAPRGDPGSGRQWPAPAGGRQDPPTPPIEDRPG